MTSVLLIRVGKSIRLKLAKEQIHNYLVVTYMKELGTLRGYFGPPMRLKYKIVFHQFVLFCLFDLILYVPSTIFQL